MVDYIRPTNKKYDTDQAVFKLEQPIKYEGKDQILFDLMNDSSTKSFSRQIRMFRQNDS